MDKSPAQLGATYHDPVRRVDRLLTEALDLSDGLGEDLLSVHIAMALDTTRKLLDTVA